MLHKILVCMVFGTTLGLAQVPAGPPYDPEVHPNPIVTFSINTDFMPTSFADALDAAGIELLGLSSAEGSRQDTAITPGSVSKVKILGRDVETLFYPVVRQRFELTDGSALTLYSFRNPKPDIPSQYLASVLNEHAFRPEDKPEESRFGGSSRPEQLEFLGSLALLFDNDGELTLFWQNEVASHVADARIDPDRLFRLLEDLL